LNILYLTKAYPIREFSISKALVKKKSYKIYSVAFSRRFANKLNKLNAKEKVFEENFDYTKFFQEHKIENNDLEFYNKQLKEFEKKYEIPSLNFAITADRYLKNKDEKFIKKHLYYSIIFFERLIKFNDISVIIGEISSATDYIAYYMSKKMDIKYIFFWHARQENKIAFSDINDNWIGLQSNYDKLKKRSLTIKEKKEVNNYISEYIDNKKIPDYMKFSDNTKKQEFDQIRDDTFFERLVNILKSYKVDIECAIDYNHSFKFKINKRIKEILHVTKKQESFFSNEIEDEKFALVPLHFQPEASTMTFAPFYLNQLSFIENLSKSIPIDYYLYVKEHPAMFKKRSNNFYEKIKTIHNVKLISPKLDIHELLDSCNAVITLTNTTGFEAIIYDKPLFVFGNVFYNLYDYAYKISNYGEINELFDIVNKWDDNNKVRKNNRLKFIKAINNSIFEGNLNNHIKDKSVLNSKNLDKISNSIIEMINYYGKKH